MEQQKQLRLADAKQVEAKAARIKDWVTNKLRELEEQNQHLRMQNAHCNDQMDLLKNRLDQLQVLGAKTKSRQNSVAEVSFPEFFPPLSNPKKLWTKLQTPRVCATCGTLGNLPSYCLIDCQES